MQSRQDRLKSVEARVRRGTPKPDRAAWSAAIFSGEAHRERPTLQSEHTAPVWAHIIEAHSQQRPDQPHDGVQRFVGMVGARTTPRTQEDGLLSCGQFL
jgi:hypothetical protein